MSRTREMSREIARLEAQLAQARADIAAKDRVLLDVAERLYAAFEVIALKAGNQWKRVYEVTDGAGI